LFVFESTFLFRGEAPAKSRSCGICSDSKLLVIGEAPAKNRGCGIYSDSKLLVIDEAPAKKIEVVVSVLIQSYWL
jgi:hypothetical protein